MSKELTYCANCGEPKTNPYVGFCSNVCREDYKSSSGKGVKKDADASAKCYGYNCKEEGKYEEECEVEYSDEYISYIFCKKHLIEVMKDNGSTPLEIRERFEDENESPQTEDFIEIPDDHPMIQFIKWYKNNPKDFDEKTRNILKKYKNVFKELSK